MPYDIIDYDFIIGKERFINPSDIKSNIDYNARIIMFFHLGKL